MTDSDDPLAGLLSVDDAAAALQVSRSTVFRYIADGELAAIKHGKRSWIERAELHDYVARKRTAATKLRAENAKRKRPRAR